jgi:hypothetical protein
MFAPEVTRAAKSPVRELTQQCSAFAARPFLGAVSPQMPPAASRDFSRIPVSQPVQNATLEAYDEPLAVFDADGNELEELPTQETEGAEQPSAQEASTGSGTTGAAGAAAASAPSERTAASAAALAQPANPAVNGSGPAVKSPGPAVKSPGPAVKGPSPAVKRPGLWVSGPREMWFFGGEAPSSYTTSAQLGSSESKGTFGWSTSGHLRLSSPSAARPTITTVARSSTLKDAKVFLTHTDAAGVTAKAGYSLTVRSPSSMTPTGNTSSAIPRGWQTLVGYSIQDQFGTTLPRAVPINEQWDNKPPIPDSAGTNWPTFAPTEGNATVNPAGWSDTMRSPIDSIPPSLVPTPAAPGSGGPLVQHFAGHWHVGRLVPPGGGVTVRNVTWRFFQDHGDHA